MKNGLSSGVRGTRNLRDANPGLSRDVALGAKGALHDKHFSLNVLEDEGRTP